MPLFNPADAVRLQGFDLSDVQPTDGQVLTWNNANSVWEAQTIAAGGVFGDDYTSAIDNTESSTTLTAFQEKLKLTTPSLTAGDYYISWQCQLRTSNNGREVTIQVELDDTTQLTQMTWDSTLDAQISGSDHQTLTAAIHTIDIDFQAESGAARTATISDARIVIWRVS